MTLSADATLARPKQGRMGSSKSKSGCLTCKIRRIKCDEKKPNCLRCSSTGRKCEYQSIHSVRSRAQVPTLLSQYEGASNAGLRADSLISISQASKQERRAFHFFFHKISPVLAGALDADFWRGAVLQLSRSQPAIWDAVIAISCLYEHPQFSSAPPVAPTFKSPVTDPNHRLALSWYSRALSSLRGQLQQNGAVEPAVALLSCTLFICIEFLQENIQEALLLYRQGWQLISDFSQGTTSGGNNYASVNPPLCMDIIAPLFYRLGALSIFYGYGRSQDWFMPRHYDSMMHFPSLSYARSALYTLLPDVIGFARASTESMQQISANTQVMASFREKQRGLRARISAWHTAFLRLINGSETGRGNDYSGTCALFQMAYAAIVVVVETHLDQDEMAFDRYLHLFEDIVRYAPSAIAATAGPDKSQPPFIFELGPGTPLFLTAQKCRDPKLRREALALLLQTPQVEGIHKIIPSAWIVANVIAIEEEITLGKNERFAPPLKSCSLPTQSKRVVDALVFYPGEDRHAGLHMKIIRRRQDSQGVWHLVEEVEKVEVP